MKNSIEEDIKNAEHFIKSIKTDKEYKEENGWHGYYNKEIVELARILEHILSDYKRVLKENERISSENGIGKRQYEELVDDYEKLNLENIELQKENEKLKKNNKELLRKLRNRVKEVKKLEKYSIYKNEFSTLNKQLQKKDEIIDIMAEEFTNKTLMYSDMSREEVKQYFINKAKEVKK